MKERRLEKEKEKMKEGGRGGRWREGLEVELMHVMMPTQARGHTGQEKEV